MRIGIVTQPLNCNYGGILQNYALQTVLKRMGHEVWTMDYRKYTWYDWFNSAWRVLAHKMLGHDVRFPLTPAAKRKQEMPLRRFAESQISLTKPRTRRINRKTAKRYKFDALIVGSDQVWRPAYNTQMEKMFLSFAEGMDVKRVAYAASFGTDEWEFSPEMTKVCASLAQKFDAISVREASGVKLCKEHLHVDATHVLDPTLLLKAEDYKNVCKDIECREPFVFAYILNANEEKKASIKTFASKKGLPYLIVGAEKAVTSDDSVEKWLSCFRDAPYIITDSFHGTAFSINFNKDFFVFLNKERGNSRFDSLLSLFGLQGRVMDDELIENCKIDWKCVNIILNDERKRCEECLNNSLK